MAKQNCWEFKKCGREVGGPKAAELGVCAAAKATKVNGIHGGKNGGRACWAVAGTLCGGKLQGTFATKISSCMACDFYRIVISEEGSNCKNARELVAMAG